MALEWKKFPSGEAWLLYDDGGAYYCASLYHRECKMRFRNDTGRAQDIPPGMSLDEAKAYVLTLYRMR